MTHEQFVALVARLEETARRDPAGYRRRVVMLALLGYFYLVFILAILAALFLVALGSAFFLKALGVKIAFVVLAFIWVVVSALWIRFAAPEGIEVRRADAPALFAMIEKLRRALDTRRFDRVLVTSDFNAAALQRPRLGLFGWYRSYLLIGLPLMKSLTPAQLEAVLAHEFGHLAKGHGRISNWVYRLRLRLQRLLEVLQQGESAGQVLFRPFFSWYAPYFQAYSFPLARANEYEADAASARLTSPASITEALTTVEVLGRYLGERFWPEIHRQADDVPSPSFAPFATMGERFKAGVQAADSSRWLDDAMARKTTVDDTHPCLAERLQALRQEPRLAPVAKGESADALLGPSLERITVHFDTLWKEQIAPSWQQHHRAVQGGRRRLAELDALAAASAALPLDKAIERAHLTESHGAGGDAAFEQFRALGQRAPDDRLVGFLLGQRLLHRNDESGFPMVERAVGMDAQITIAAFEALRDFCWRRGATNDAHAWHAFAMQATQELALARAERARFDRSDKFEPHGLSDAAIAALREQLQAIPKLRKAYLARKIVKHLPERPLLVLAFSVTPWWGWKRERIVLHVQETILDSVAFPHQASVFCLDANATYAYVVRKIRRLPGSRIL